MLIFLFKFSSLTPWVFLHFWYWEMFFSFQFSTLCLNIKKSKDSRGRYQKYFVLPKSYYVSLHLAHELRCFFQCFNLKFYPQHSCKKTKKKLNTARSISQLRQKVNKKTCIWTAYLISGRASVQQLTTGIFFAITCLWSLCQLPGFTLILRANLAFSFNLWFIRDNFKRKGWKGTIVSWLNNFSKKSSLLMDVRQKQFEPKKKGSNDWWRKLNIYSFLFLEVAVLTKLYTLSQVQNLNQIFLMRTLFHTRVSTL